MEPKPIRVTRTVKVNKFEADPSGVTTIKRRPGCFMYVMMLPYPFLSLGCCLPGSESTILVFNDNTRTISYERYKGLFTCCSTKATINYTEVANVYIVLVPNMRINKQAAYKVVLFLEDGSNYSLSGAKLYGPTEEEARKWHQFMFGRFSHNYHPPASFLLPVNVEYELS
eukprot:TRINITY_DN6651_c0_g1_i1.p1 TRINITY_DN6651_c0_g1~~TRINITY_DN6651_c0_g1_i1.p1  ORF type:complete len:170 (+),score=18.55 TRINITY_DN6651_c0_g1_i1:60-569(+)